MLLDLVRSGTFALAQAAAGFGVGYGCTGSVAAAAGMALALPCVNGFLFFLHERAWKVALRRKAAHRS